MVQGLAFIGFTRHSGVKSNFWCVKALRLIVGVGMGFRVDG